MSIKPALYSIILLHGLAGGVSEPRQDPAASPRKATVFDPATLAPGDSVGPFRVARAAFRPAPPDSAWVGTATFEGDAQVEGHYAAHLGGADDPSLAATPCLYADAAGFGLPQAAGDARRAWLCFSNPDEASAALGAPPQAEGPPVRVLIRAFRYVYSFTDAVNEAEWVGLVPQ